jgi:hypothetical protein
MGRAVARNNIKSKEADGYFRRYFAAAFDAVRSSHSSSTPGAFFLPE